MNPSFRDIHRDFRLNGTPYGRDALQDAAYSYIKEGELFEKKMGDFLLDWLDHNDSIKLLTSGSTGPQKMIEVSKEAMVNSALATGRYFNLSPKDSALLCLPADYIAGKMMLVRAIVLGLHLEIREPEALVIFDYERHYDFCAMVPLQLRKCIDRIHNIKTLIVGGAAIPSDLISKVQELPTHIYETYGMTETISHIAVKPINHTGASTYFKALPDVAISQDDRGCLVIDAPLIRKEKIITNDIVEMNSDTEFEIIGRFDNVINTGGVKIFPEQIETKLQNKISRRFFIASEEDADLGEKVILVIEGKEDQLIDGTFSELSKFEKPRNIYFVDKFMETSSKKIQREAILKSLK